MNHVDHSHEGGGERAPIDRKEPARGLSCSWKKNILNRREDRDRFLFFSTKPLVFLGLLFPPLIICHTQAHRKPSYSFCFLFL